MNYENYELQTKIENPDMIIDTAIEENVSRYIAKKTNLEHYVGVMKPACKRGV